MPEVPVRWVRWLRRRLRRLALALVALVVAVPAGQSLLLRVVEPPLTLTMLSRAVEASGEARRLTWPDHRPVRLADLPPHVPHAFLSAEDQRFHSHRGFDREAIEAAWASYRGGEARLRGGSTISQQVARNVFLWQGRTWLRKGIEAWYTVWLELLVPKDRILEVYLNVAETGPMVFGVEAGARHWFDKPAADLTPEEAALLASLLPAPRSRTPEHPASRRRAAWILRNPAPRP